MTVANSTAFVYLRVSFPFIILTFYISYCSSKKVKVKAFTGPSLGVFTETFLDHYCLDICKSNAKTHKTISINSFGITCCYFSSRNIPAIALFSSTFLSNLVLSRSNQCFGCGLDQSHCRKLDIQIWLWPRLLNNSFNHFNETKINTIVGKIGPQ